MAQQEQRRRWPPTPRSQVARETRLLVRGDPPSYSRSRMLAIPGVALWEFFDEGGWEVFSPDLQDFLNDQYHNLVDETRVWVDEAKTIIDGWGFVKLEQTRWVYIGGNEWVNDKTRSIRRVQILTAPANAVG